MHGDTLVIVIVQTLQLEQSTVCQLPTPEAAYIFVPREQQEPRELLCTQRPAYASHDHEAWLHKHALGSIDTRPTHTKL